MIYDRRRRSSASRRAGLHQPAAGRRDQPDTAKTQAALLEAMEERQVTVDGGRGRCPSRSRGRDAEPVEYEGTYPLPEAQLDRFLFKIRIDLPERAAEIEVLEPARPGLRPARPRLRPA